MRRKNWRGRGTFILQPVKHSYLDCIRLDTTNEERIGSGEPVHERMERFLKKGGKIKSLFSVSFSILPAFINYNSFAKTSLRKDEEKISLKFPATVSVSKDT